MVKKLFKHEMNAYWRVLIPVWIILLGVALLGRIVQIFEMDNTVYNIISGSAYFMYGVGVLVALVFPSIYAIIRYYTNFFTGEGYLTFTLPTTSGRLLWVKILTAGLMELLSLLAALVSVAVITAGDVLVELWKAGMYLMNQLHLALGSHLTFFILEAVLLVLALLLYTTVFYETCINIGQLFRKRRILAAVGVYFAFYVLEQIVGTIALIVAAFVDMDSVFEFISKNPYLCAHGFMCGMLVFTAALTAVFYAVSHHIVSKRLNLE